MSEVGVTIAIRPAVSLDDVALARRLFVDYQASLGIDLCFQGFSHELETLPGLYAPPEGVLLLAAVDGAVAGCCAMRPLPKQPGDGAEVGARPHVCEMKRLFVRPSFRGLSVGRRLVAAVMERARHAGYKTMVLDTLSDMDAARALYGEAGFVPVEAYNDNPIANALFFEADLTRAPRASR